MGREIKRVAKDFEWPLEKVWKGYLNPHYADSNPCYECEGSGYSEKANLYKDQWYGYVEFDPVAYGSELITRETPSLKQFVERQVDRSISQAANGTALEFKDGRSSYTSNKCYYTNNGALTREEAIVKESDRLIEIFNNQWCHHLNEEDVKALVDKDRLIEFTRTLRPEHSLEDFIRTHAYYLWIESGCEEGKSEYFWEKAKEKYDKSRWWLPYKNGYIPTAKEVNDWSIGGFGHDSSNSYTCIKARCQRNGHDSECNVCNGEGTIWYPLESKELAENWERTHPPSGDAYQVWETVSEGSPISPVFSDPLILAEWMANSKPWGAAQEMSVSQWLEFITGPGWAPSGVVVDGVFKDGVAASVS